MTGALLGCAAVRCASASSPSRNSPPPQPPPPSVVADHGNEVETSAFLRVINAQSPSATKLYARFMNLFTFFSDEFVSDGSVLRGAADIMMR